MTTSTTRTRRPAHPVDARLFADQVHDALLAFAEDVTYAVAMARAAAVIIHKRAMWAARAQLREAEARAHTLCATTAAFECHATSACGTGDCKFAVGEHAALTVAAPDGDHTRPQVQNTGNYSLDAAVAALAARRRPRARTHP
jgi:Tfp pilus assembly protein PilX